MDPVGFDRKCTAATDCVVVKRAGCDPCGCAYDGIASKDMARFDEVARKLACDPPDLRKKCATCERRVARCEGGLCIAAPGS